MAGMGEVIAGVGLSVVLGAGYGIAVENNTNEVAEGKIITVETCRRTVPHESVLTHELEECMKKGVPGGRKISGEKFVEGQPITFVEAYVDAQQQEAGEIEVGRVAGWSVAPIGAAIVYFGL